jgi:muramoyltetrapeptide carboxypeptidase
MEVIKPKKLQRGDTVAIVSPSGAVPESLRGQFDAGVAFLESLGLKVVIGKHALGQRYYASGTVEERLSDIHEAFADEKVKAVIMSIGGSAANQLLDGLDYDLIRKNPKIFCGISDGTTLLNPIFTKTGLVTYHGPDLVFTFGLPMSRSIKENMTKTFFEGEVGNLQPNSDWKGMDKLNANEKYGGWRTVRGGKASGRLVGGNESCLLKLEGTDFKPDYKGGILLLEAYGKSAEKLDCAFTQMRQAHIFDEINGVILGYFYGSHVEDAAQDREVRDVLLEVTKEYSFPIIEIGELGHCVENYVFPIGCEATIDADTKSISIDEVMVV